MTNTTTKTPAAGTARGGDTEGHDFPEATSCPYIVSQTWHKIKPCHATAGAVILPLLGSGRGNAKKRRELLATTGLPDRVFRKGIEGLRRAGVVICSGDHGYFLPATPDEVQGFIRQEEARARSTFFTLQSARQLEAKMLTKGEQLTWGGGEM